MSTANTILSGIMPTGTPHIGNYLGAIKQWVDMQKDYCVLVMIADLHAITTPQDPKELHSRTLELAGLLLACGIDPKHSTLFLQSHVPAHSELGWIFNTMTSLGELERMTQFKEKSDRKGTYAGLLNYPTLQAADILLYQPNAVPIGEDQLQHLELTRDLAQKFNNRFGKTFAIPKPFLIKNSARVMGLNDPAKKMSKSATSQANYISLLDSADEIQKKIRAAVTDSGNNIQYDPETKPAIANLINIMRAFSLLTEKEIEEKYKNKGYAEFKFDLAKIIIKKLIPIQKQYHLLAKHPNKIMETLRQGADQASKAAHRTLHMVKEKMGFLGE